MKFSVGDAVLIKATDEEGVVEAILSADTIQVNVGGVSFPVSTDAAEHPYLKWFTRKKKSTPQPKSSDFLFEPEDSKQKMAHLPKGIYFSFFPVYTADVFEDVVSELKIYLLNELPLPVEYSYNALLSGQSIFKHQGVIYPFSNIHLHTISIAEMNGQPRFEWLAQVYKEPKYIAQKGKYMLPASKLFEQLAQIQQKNEASFSHLLLAQFDTYTAAELEQHNKAIEGPELSKSSKERPVVIKSLKQLEKAPDVIDLHIDKLMPKHKGMSNSDIIQLQLKVFQETLQLAIIHKQQQLTVIHGLGKGTLRDAVHKILKQTPEVKSFKNEWHGKYGFGATEIYF